MNGISHQQAIKWIHRRLDGLLTANQTLLLDQHLNSCDTCRAYVVETGLLVTQLQSQFHDRWDNQMGPSQKVMDQITTKTRRIPMQKRITSGTKLLAGAATLIMLGFLINLVISQLQSTSTSASETETANNSGLAENRLLAFASDQNGNLDIYTMHADGSGLTNITNNPAYDTSPFWSPDGKRIAFISDRSGTPQIYRMDADGSNVIQLTSGEGGYGFDINGSTPWSPDGRKLIFVHKSPEEQNNKLYMIDIYEKTTATLTQEPGVYLLPSWSPDGNHIAFTEMASPARTDLFITDGDGTRLTKLTENLQGSEVFLSDYYWSQDGKTLIFIAPGGTFTTVYGASSDGSRKVLYRAGENAHILDWWNGTALSERFGDTLTWLRPDSSQSTLDLCPNSRFQLLGMLQKRSNSGNLILASNCSENDWMFYWSNSDGTEIDQLLDSPIFIAGDSLFNPTWSLDDRYVAFVGLETRTLYVLDVAKAREDPSVKPVKVPNGYDPSWQPLLKDQIVEENPPPARTPPVPAERLIAFASDQTGDSDIFVIHPDGTGLTNLTNNPARDSNPIWSPDGKRIAFESDREGASQIYWMNADGSDVIQLTRDQADHFLPMNIHGNSDPWSPDGTKLLFLGQEPGASTSTLYSLDISTGTVVILASGTVQFNTISWSPDGKYIGYVLNDSPTPDTTFVGGLYVVGSTGSSRIVINTFLPQTDSLHSASYYWYPGENAIIFVAYRHLGQGSDQWIAYEAFPETQQLVERATSSTIMDDWWEGTSLIHGTDPYILRWLRADGTSNILDPLENCDLTMEADYGFLARRSPNGSQLINVVCPNKDMWFYYANPDGTIIKSLADDPIVSFTPDRTATTLNWSSDDRFIAVTQVSPAKSSLYILNVSGSSTSPVEIVISDGEFYTVPSWQSVSSKETVREEPTPAVAPPPSSQVDNRVLIFASIMENGNPDIYTVRSDGSGLTNLTNHPAYDDHPFWSPDGARIAFESNRSGSTQIYVMDADGSDVIQVTDGEKEHRFEYSNPWSPDGNRLIITESEPFDPAGRAPADAQWTLFAVDMDGQNKTPIAAEPGRYTVPSWSPDASHIGYVRVVPVGEREMARIFVVDASGNNLTNVARLLPDDEDIHTWAFSWTQGGRAISFVTDRVSGENYNGRSAAYEASLDGATLVELGHSSTPMLDWHDGTAFTIGVGGESPFTWLRSDGTYSTLNPLENCETSTETQFNYMYSRSQSGELLIGVNCPNNDLWLYRANWDGTVVKPLLDSPITERGFSILNIAWSADARFVALNLASTDKRLMGIYIIDVQAALRDPSQHALQIMTGRDATMYYWYPAWQPTP